MPTQSEPCDRRPAAAVGRHARLELTFGCRKGRTVLQDAYAEPPFRLGRCFPDGSALHMIMAASSPGVFGGDWLQQIIRVGPGARVRLTSQSALQIHAAPDAALARVRSAYHVQDGARLHCHWDPMIPFAGARLDQRLEMHVADGGYLYWSDAFMTGRRASGEHWMFATLRHELKMFLAGSLEYLERYCIEPCAARATRRWAAGDAAYLGTTFTAGDAVNQDTAERLHADLAAMAGVSAAVDRLAPRLLLARVIGQSGPAFYDARDRVARALA